MGWMTKGLSLGKGWEFFSSLCPDRLWGPPSLLSTGYRAFSLGVKWPGHEADHSPQSSAMVKECMELYLHSPITLSWHAQLKKKKTQGQLSLLPLPLYQKLHISFGLDWQIVFSIS
jgi:hypothetical protein